MRNLAGKLLFGGLFMFAIVTHATPPFRFQTTSPVFVIGGVDGSHENLVLTLKSLGLVDSLNNWSGGESHLVSLGNLVGLKENSYEPMGVIIRLQQQAELKGGRVHAIMGVNELAAYEHLFRSSNKSISEEPSDEEKRQVYLELKYQRWLISLPFVLKINQQLFAHNGLPTKVTNFELGELNRLLKEKQFKLVRNDNLLLKRELKTTISDENEPEEKKITFEPHPLASDNKELDLSQINPLNYQGNVECHPFFETDKVAKTLARFDVQTLWVENHNANRNKPLSRLQKQLFILNSSAVELDGKAFVWAAKIDGINDVEWINGLSGSKVTPVQFENRNYQLPHSFSEEQIRDFLRTATVIAKEETEYGITKPYKITMQKDGKTIKGIFKYEDTRPNNHVGRWKRDDNYADRYQYEVAAYELDRMLNIGLVPISVERVVENKSGVVSLWIDGLISELKINEEKIAINQYCDLKDQQNMLDIFDFLIRNTDRNQSNTLFSESDGQVWFIDHSRSFGSSTRRPDLLKKSKMRLTNRFKMALDRLSRDELEALRPWLHKKQIKAIWIRRNKLIRGKF